MRYKKFKIKKFYYIIIAAALLLFFAVNFYIKVNAANTSNIAYQALMNNDLVKLSRYIFFIKDKDMSIDGKSLLMYAVENSNSDAVDILGGAGANCNTVSGNNTALLEALREEKFDIVEKLISKYNGNVNSYISNKPYIALLIDENNYNACEFLLDQKETNFDILIQNNSLGVYLFTKDSLDSKLANLFADKLMTDESFDNYIIKKYDILNFGGAYALSTLDDNIPYIFVGTDKDNRANTVVLFKAEKFSQHIYSSLSINSTYIAFEIDTEHESLRYISGINYYSSFSDDKKNTIINNVDKYLQNNISTIFGINNDNIYAIAPLLYLKDDSKYAMYDLFTLDDDAYEILLQDYVDVTTDINKTDIKDIDYQQYYSSSDIKKAKKTIYFTLRLFPLSITKQIDHIYLVRYAEIDDSNVQINGAFMNNDNIIITKTGNATTMVATYIHEFSHFITKENDREGLLDITKENSKYGYYEDYEGSKYYDISCLNSQGDKKDFLDIYGELLKNDEDVFRKDGFVRGYSTYNSWEDFATTAESMYSFIDEDYFVDYVAEKKYDTIQKKFEYVKKTYNQYSLQNGGDEFMNNEYFNEVKQYLKSFDYNASTMQT
jgi:ankyrin repeat protein